MKNFIKLLLFVVVGSLISCATFREGNVEYQKIEATNATKKSISFAVTGQFKFNTNESVPQNANALGSWANVVKEEFNSSSLFSEVKNNEKNTDLSVDINVQSNGYVDLTMSMVTGLTLYLIPSSAKDEFVVEATFKNKSGKEIAKIQKRDSVKTWTHLTMLFVFPFKPLAKEVEKCQKDLINAILVEANSKGILK